MSHAAPLTLSVLCSQYIKIYPALHISLFCHSSCLRRVVLLRTHIPHLPMGHHFACDIVLYEDKTAVKHFALCRRCVHTHSFALNLAKGSVQYESLAPPLLSLNLPTHLYCNAQWVRANQGHSQPIINLLLQPPRNFSIVVTEAWLSQDIEWCEDK